MKSIAWGFVASLLLAGASFAAPADSNYRGEIMDSACAASGSHDAMTKGTSMTAKDCTLACVKHGAKFVLYNPTTKTVYELDDQSKPEQFAGDKVVVSGTLDKATKTIHVTSIKGS